jgi:hypothetical protein
MYILSRGHESPLKPFAALLSAQALASVEADIRPSESNTSRRRLKRPWKAGEGAKLPSWLHILIRKREKRDGSSLTMQKRHRQPTTSGPLRQKLFPPAPSELTTLIMQTNTLNGLSSIVHRHSSDGPFKDLPLGPRHLTALYQKTSWIARQQDHDRTRLSMLLENLDSKLFEVLPRMDMRGISSILWSKGMMGGKRLDPILLESILGSMNASTDITLSPLLTPSTPNNQNDPWLRGAGTSSSAPSSSSSSRRLTNAPLKKVTAPRISTATSQELTDLCTGLSWLSVDMSHSQKEWKWTPLMNAIARHARLGSLEPQQLSDVLYSLRACGMRCEPHHLEDLSARAVKCLPHLTPLALINDKQQPSDEEIDKAIHRSTNAIANVCLGLSDLGLDKPGRRLKDAAVSAIQDCLVPLLSIHQAVPRDEMMQEMMSSMHSKARDACDEQGERESFPLSLIDDPDLLPSPLSEKEDVEPHQETPTQHPIRQQEIFVSSRTRQTVQELMQVLTSWRLSDEDGSRASAIAKRLMGKETTSCTD